MKSKLAEFQGSYEVVEAARYLYPDVHAINSKYKINSSHLIRWIRYGLADPKLISIPGRQMMITFEDLVSMRVIAFLRAYNYSFPEIRKAEKLLRQITGHVRPFGQRKRERSISSLKLLHFCWLPIKAVNCLS